MKFIVAYDTICQGWQCMKDEHEKPVLFNSELDAWKEILDSAIAHAEGNKGTEFTETTPEQLAEMRRIDETGALEDIKNFFNNNPECNDSEEFVVQQDEYIHGRKAIFTGNGVVIEGSPA